MNKSNVYRWQQERIKLRLEILDRILNNINENNITFRRVTYLARYVANIITSTEHQTLHEVPELNIKISPRSTCRASSLLKNKVYRSRLDMWMRQNNDIGAQENSELTELRFKLLKLSNEHSIVVDELRSLQEIHSHPTVNHAITTDRNDGMTIAQMIIRHFYEFCEIHDGALVEPSPGLPIIVPNNLFSAYLKWKSNMY